VEGALRVRRSENDPDRRGHYRFLATGDPEDFRRLGTRFLQLPIGEVSHVDVAEPTAKEAA
jgi:glutamate racemase